MFHEAAFRLLPAPLRRSTASVQALERREKELGLRFPASVREWYSLEGAVETLRTCSNQDRPVAVEELGAPRLKWYGVPRRDFVADGFLYLMNENQGVCQWAVRLDGDDPEVVVAVDTAPSEVWLPHAATFSEFIRARLWDHRPAALGLSAQDVGTRREDVEALRAAFREGPRTTHWPGDAQWRFEDGSGSILLWEAEGQTDWFLRAASEPALEALGRKVIDRAGLRTSLYAGDPASGRVLRKLS